MTFLPCSLALLLLGFPTTEPGLVDEPFRQDAATMYTVGEGIPGPGEMEDGDIQSIAVSPEGIPIAARGKGSEASLLSFDGETWRIFADPPDSLTEKRVYWEAGGGGHISEMDSIVATAVLGNGVYCLASPDEVRQLKDREPGAGEIIFHSDGESILSLAGREDGAVAIGTDKGLYLRNGYGESFEKVYPADARYSWAPRKVGAVTFDVNGRIWFGSDQGVGVYDGSEWRLYTGSEGLPYNHFTCAAAGGDGSIWFGTERGAIRFDGGRFSYRAGGRWLPDDRVNDLAVDETGAAWIATPRGISRIERRPMTLEEKARHFIDVTEERHVRDGFIADRSLTRQGDPASAVEKITDNDGQYTAWYGSALILKYAMTGDPEAKAIAKRSFEACKWLVDIVPDSMKGFPARVIIPVDWPEPVNEQYGEAYNRAKREDDPFWKLITPRFPLSEDGKYRWKCDTSSDELAGHYLIYDLYYDLVAETEEEKAPVREVVRDITDHLIRNDFNLVDHDGKPTRWARFGPDFLNEPDGYVERGLNSMMILSFLATAERIVGDPKYGEAASMLREKYFYHSNVLNPRQYFPPSEVAPWDNGFVVISGFLLMKNEKDPELLLLYRQGLEHGFQFISKQKNAFWNMLYAAAARRFSELADEGYFENAFPDKGPFAESLVAELRDFDPDLGGSLEMLRELPLDLVAWRMENSHRLDFQQDPTPTQAKGYGWSKRDGKAFPISERGHVRLDRDCFDVDIAEGGEGSGFSLHEGTIYLLPYYLGRRFGFIR